MEPKEKKAFEPSGLVPRSIVRTFERFRQQLLPGSETAAIREYRISRYQVLVSVRCLFTLLIIPIATNWLVSSWLLSPLVEHFWNTQQNEIFLNSYQEERAFAELESFSEKLFFESLLNTTNIINVDSLPLEDEMSLGDVAPLPYVQNSSFASSGATSPRLISPRLTSKAPYPKGHTPLPFWGILEVKKQELRCLGKARTYRSTVSLLCTYSKELTCGEAEGGYSFAGKEEYTLYPSQPLYSSIVANVRLTSEMSQYPFTQYPKGIKGYKAFTPNIQGIKELGAGYVAKPFIYPFTPLGVWVTHTLTPSHALLGRSFAEDTVKAPSLLSTYNSANSLKIKEKVQNKILELAIYYNQQTIISITNIVGDVVSLVTLGCLFIWMKPEITILKSFLIEAIYSLSDTTKSFLLILLTDLLVGFHSPRGWETALELLLKHFGLPENQDFVFLFVATFPVLLDTVFKYWIFRHLNKISPSTVATYHSMIE